MRSFFSIDNPIFRGISRIGDLFMLSFFWLITSLPIVTIGASTTALFDVSIKILRKRDGGIIKTFFVSFKNNFKQSTIIWLIMLAAGVILYLDIQYWAEQSGTIALVIGAISIGIAVVFLGILHYIFAVQAVFDNPIKATIRTAYLMAIRHWVTSLSLLLCSAALYYLCVLFPIAQYGLLLFGTGLFALIYSTRLLSVFRKYNDTLLPEVDESNNEPILQVISRQDKKRRLSVGHGVSYKGSKVIK